MGYLDTKLILKFINYQDSINTYVVILKKISNKCHFLKKIVEMTYLYY